MLEEQGKLGESLKKTRKCIIKNELGLHLRPAGLFVKTAKNYHSTITVEKDGVRADGKSILGITTLNVSKNSTITIEACGKDADHRRRHLCYPHRFSANLDTDHR